MSLHDAGSRTMCMSSGSYHKPCTRQAFMRLPPCDPQRCPFPNILPHRVFGDFQFLDVPSTCSREGFMPRMLQEVDPEAEQMGAGIIVGWLVLSLLLPLGELTLA